MKFIKLIFITLLLSACVSNSPKQSAVAETPVSSATKNLVIKTIVFSEPDEVRTAIKNECSLQEKLASFIQEYTKGEFNIVENDPNADVLEIEITDAQGHSGGAWSGAKMVAIKGELKRHGQTISNFKAKRFSGGGAFAQFKSTCAILGRCVKTLGKDTAEWLKDPVKNALLGDM